jgi:Mlc titration factor MtfA (ptsG expression regulator)
MFFSLLKHLRRDRLLAQPFPTEWFGYLDRNVVHYRHLSLDEQAKLRDDLRVFIAEKNWEGCRGLQLTDEIKVTIAAYASLLVLALEPDSLGRVQSILVYPDTFRVPDARDRFGLVHEEGDSRSGEAWYRGPVILSWADALHDARHPRQGRSLPLHEFAHQLDMLTGAADGMPPLEGVEPQRRWQEVMTVEYQRLGDAVEHGEATLLDPYGATHPAEFFAVASECFFVRPLALERRHPALYEVLRDYFRQDPAARRRVSKT